MTHLNLSSCRLVQSLFKTSFYFFVFILSFPDIILQKKPKTFVWLRLGLLQKDNFEDYGKITCYWSITDPKLLTS